MHRIGSFNVRIRLQVVRMQAEVLSPGTYSDPSVGIFSQLFRWTPCRTGRLDAAFVQPDTGSALCSVCAADRWTGFSGSGACGSSTGPTRGSHKHSARKDNVRTAP